MARIRTIKPEFFTSEDIVSMSPLARLFYVSLWCEADREGRLEWKPGTFKMRYLPGDDCNVQTLAGELIERGLIALYEVGGKTFAEIPSFTRHQVINNRESDSALPARPDATRTRAPRVKAEGKEGKGRKGREPASDDPAFVQFWEAWPANDRKQDKGKCADKFKADGLEAVLPQILADITVKKQTEKWRGGFIEAPEVYLNNRRWEDGITGEQADLAPVNRDAERTAAEQAKRDAEWKADRTPEAAAHASDLLKAARLRAAERKLNS